MTKVVEPYHDDRLAVCFEIDEDGVAYSYLTGTIEDAEADPIKFTVLDDCVNLKTANFDYVALSPATAYKILGLIRVGQALQDWLVAAPRTHRQMRTQAKKLATRIGFPVTVSISV